MSKEAEKGPNEKEASNEESPEVEKAVKYNWIPRESNEEKVDRELVETKSDPMNVSQGVREDFLDPLRMEEKNKVKYSAQINIGIVYEKDETVMNWKHKKEEILNIYRTDKTLPIYSSILFGHVDEENITFENKIKQRLSILSADTDKRTITQKKYIKFLEELDEELKKAWNEHNDRVHSLKIVIKCTKMLSKTVVPEFYPSMFVIVCEVMDTFGNLVFQRIKSKACVKDRYTKRVVFRLPEEFKAVQVPPRAKEIAKNWFFKISSIRELIARLYVEMMIVHSRKFLFPNYDEDMKREVLRLAQSLRGIGDPLVANYGRFYLARQGSKLLPGETGYLLTMLQDIVHTMDQIDQKYFQTYLQKVTMTKDEYTRLFIPPVEWIIESLGNSNKPEKVYRKVMRLYTQQCPHLTFFLHSIARSFPPKVIAADSYSLIEMAIDQYKEVNVMFPQYRIFLALGKQFAHVPPKEKKKLDILNTIWKVVTKYEVFDEYLKVCAVFVEYVVKSFSLKEVNVLLRDLHSHIIPQKDKMDENIENKLQAILVTILHNTTNVIELFDMEFFLPIFDLLKSVTRLEVSKGILYVIQRSEASFRYDPVAVNSLVDLSKIVHQSVNYLTPKEDWEYIEGLIYWFIKSVEFNDGEEERELDFYVEARKNFPNFDKVYELVVWKTIRIIERMNKQTEVESESDIIQRVKKSKKFVKTCQSFLHITIPSIQDIFLKLRAYLLVSQVCLFNDMVPQGEELLKTAISLVDDVPQFFKTEKNMIVSNEDKLVEFVGNLSSTLVAVPGHPRFGPFFLVKGLLNTIQKYAWEKKSCGKIRCYNLVMYSLGPLFHSDPPYRYKNLLIQNLDMFDEKKIKKEAHMIAQTVLTQIANNIETLKFNLSDSSVTKNLQIACIEVFNMLIGTSVINKQVTSLIENCYKFVRLASDGEVMKWMRNSVKSLKKKNPELYRKVVKGDV